MSKYLGKDFTCLASYGHVRDLLPKQGAVDTENDFGMKYVLIEKNKKHVDAIVKAMKKADSLYLATDPDREGEAISWHLHEILKAGGRAGRQAGASRGVSRNHQDRDPACDRAAAQAVREPHQRAAGAARARLPGGLQPVAAAVEKGAPRAVGRARAKPGAAADRRARGGDRELQGARVLDHRVRSDHQGQGLRRPAHPFQRRKARAIHDRQRRARRGSRRRPAGQGAGPAASAVGREEAAPRNPAPPFTTSTLQQEASRKLGFTAQRTMRTAQQLYEGMDLGMAKSSVSSATCVPTR